MLSRVAENLYWIARYVERAENTARLISVTNNLMLDLPRGVKPGWQPLIEILGAEGSFDANDGDERAAIRFLIGDLANTGSILSSLGNARGNARTVRDFLPREAWEQINDLYLKTRLDLQRGLSQRHRYDYLRSIIIGAQSITGLLAGTMTHDNGYDFIRMGRNLERGDMTTRIIDVRSANLLPEQTTDLTPFENIQWMSVLKSMSAYQMYRRELQVRVRRADVLRFLFQHPHFPRAFYHCVGEVEQCLANLPRNDAPLRVVAHLKRIVTEASPESLSQDELHAFIDDLQLGMIDLNEQINQTYFRPPEPVVGDP